MKVRPLDIRVTASPRRSMKILLFDGRRIRTRVSSFFAPVSFSGLNEIFVTIDESNYVVHLNGRNVAQISGRDFGNKMAHRNQFEKIKAVRATSTLPVRRLAVTEGGRVERWENNANDPNCGFTFEMPREAASDRDRATVSNFVNYHANKCVTRRDGVDFNVAAAHVVGGVTTIPGQFPWLVSLRIDNFGTVKHECGASLINKKWAISAAHCFASRYVADNYKVYVGDYSVENEDFNKERTHVTSVAKFYNHPEFNLQTMRNDIALVMLAEAVPSYNQFRAPICLPTSSHQFGAGDCCQVAGWGKTASNEADLKKFVELDEQCARQIRGYTPLYTRDTPLVPDKPMFTFQEIFAKDECAEMTRGGMDPSGAQFCATKRLECHFMADTCQGDSGGPFICNEPAFFESEQPKMNLDGRQYSLANTDRAVLWGITSNGGSRNAQGVKTGCGDATGDSTGAGVYTSTATYMDWILGVFRKNNFSPSG